MPEAQNPSLLDTSPIFKQALVVEPGKVPVARKIDGGLRDENGNLYDIVCGTFFLCGAPSDTETFASLTPEQIARLERQFHTPEIFVGMGGRIVCLPME